MKYFNHLTCAFNDEKVSFAVASGGLRIYGAYWVLVETIAAQIRPESVATHLTLSWSQWGSKLLVEARTARSLALGLRDAGLIFVEENGKRARIDIPNILKYADEYSRRVLKLSGHTPEKSRDTLGRKSGSPDLLALPEEQDLKPGPVDNSEICGILTDAAASGGSLKAPPAAASTSRPKPKINDPPGQMTEAELIEAARLTGRKPHAPNT